MSRLIYKRELLRLVGLSYPTIWKMMREHRFPRSVVIGSRSAWHSDQIEDFLAKLPTRRLKGDPPEPQADNGSTEDYVPGRASPVMNDDGDDGQ
jgi:predicted DNA-binding transcriptional regulator AlpA